MAVKCVAAVLLNLPLICLQMSMGLKLQINQPHFTDESTGPLQMTCLPDASDIQKHVMVLELGKEGQDPMAFVSRRSGVTYGTVAPTTFQASGQIGDNGGLTQLTLTIPNPQNDVTGSYLCTMYYFGGSGAFKHESVDANVTVEVVNAHSQANSMQRKIDALEDGAKAQTSEVSELQNVVKVMMNEISVLKVQLNDQASKVSFRCAFSASLIGTSVVTFGSVVVFGDVIMETGDGYNEKTGVFTAPRAGLYVFHVVMAAAEAGEGSVLLKANGVAIARLAAEQSDNRYDVQSSVSSITSLAKGDTVNVVSGDRVTWWGGNKHYSVFTGYLLQAY